MSTLNSVNFENSYMQKCWRQENLGVSNSNRVGNKFCQGDVNTEHIFGNIMHHFS